MAADSKAQKKTKHLSKVTTASAEPSPSSRPSKRKSAPADAGNVTTHKAKKPKKADSLDVKSAETNASLEQANKSKKKRRAVASDFLGRLPDTPLPAADTGISKPLKKQRKLPDAVAERLGAADGVTLEISAELPQNAKVLADGEARRVSSEVVKKKKEKEKSLKDGKKNKVVEEEQVMVKEVVVKEPKTAKKGSKKTAKPKSPSPSPQPSEDPQADAEWAGFSSEDEQEEGGNDAEEGSDEVDMHLHGFSSSDQDSSDEESDLDGDEGGIDVGSLPTIAKDDATVKRKLDKAKKAAKAANEDRGVLYLGRLPHGFYEAQLRAYFTQFGDVTRLRLSRNKQTGRSKHYAFIEFDSTSVAKIVAETMDNYLLYGRLLQCRVMTPEEIHPKLWIGANRTYRVVPRARIARVRHDKERTDEQREKVERRLMRRQEQSKRKLKEAGIDYAFDLVAWKKARNASED